jgi:hypothetical protein
VGQPELALDRQFSGRLLRLRRGLKQLFRHSAMAMSRRISSSAGFFTLPLSSGAGASGPRTKTSSRHPGCLSVISAYRATSSCIASSIGFDMLIGVARRLVARARVDDDGLQFTPAPSGQRQEAAYPMSRF